MGMRPVRWLMSLFLLVHLSTADAEGEGFVETFDGTGEYDSRGLVYSGLDNPGWLITGDGDGELRDGAFVLTNEAMPTEPMLDRLLRQVGDVGSFRERVELRNVDLGNIEDDLHSRASFGLMHDFSPDIKHGDVSVGFLESENTAVDEWQLQVDSEYFRYRESVPKGPNVALEFVLHLGSPFSEVSVNFDNDFLDDVPGLSFGPFAYKGTLTSEHTTAFGMSAVQAGKANAYLDNWSLSPFSVVPGDFNLNGSLDVADLNLLAAQIRDSNYWPRFDVNGDLKVNSMDRTAWLHDLRRTYYGDANLDGLFNSVDLVVVFQVGRYENDVTLDESWQSGDWNGDGRFDSTDLVLAFQDGGYDQGPLAAVPEPELIIPAISFLLLCVARRRAC